MRTVGTMTLALIISVAASTEADARKRHKVKRHGADNARVVQMLKQLTRENAAIRRELGVLTARLRPDNAAPVEQPAQPTNPVLVVPPVSEIGPTLKGYGEHIAKSAKLKDLTPKLANKVAEILTECPGARLTSGHRPGARVRGSRRPSLHSVYPSQAADLAGNPSCIRARLEGWIGGASTDYAAVRHYHISYSHPGGREFGARFTHYGHGKRRYARKHYRHHPRHARHHHRYAQVRSP